jgi:hypothetical protein
MAKKDAIKTLREYYDRTDQSEAIRRATASDQIVDEVLVSTSIRLPRSVMDQIRDVARTLDMPATTLMREWLLERLHTSPTESVVSVAELERFIARNSHPAAS